MSTATAMTPRDVEHRPQPLARATLVFNSPSEPGTQCEIEIVVCDDNADGMLTWHDSSDSRRAGWCKHSIGNFVIAFRTQG